MEYACRTCRDPRIPPDLVWFAGRVAGPVWRLFEVSTVQAAVVETAMRMGYCDKHVSWMSELVGWAVRQDAAARAALVAAAESYSRSR